jgi:hypothetical protein
MIIDKIIGHDSGRPLTPCLFPQGARGILPEIDLKGEIDS